MKVADTGRIRMDLRVQHYIKLQTRLKHQTCAFLIARVVLYTDLDKLELNDVF